MQKSTCLKVADAPTLRVVGMGGEPAAGKTTIINLLRQRFPACCRPFKFGKVRGLADPDRAVIFIGVYDGSTWEGSDKLSMAVQPDFELMLRSLARKACTVYFEGDRLFNPSLFERFPFIRGLVIRADSSVLGDRHRARKDNQPEQFLKAKRTKVERMVQRFGLPVLPNNSPAEQVAIVDWLFGQAADVRAGQTKI